MFGHPLHPIAVHLPIVLLVGGVLVDVASVWRCAWRKAGFFHLVLGTVGALTALLTGRLDAPSVPSGGASTVLQLHTVLAILATLVFGLMAAGRVYFRIRHARLRAPGDPEANVPAGPVTAYFALAAVGVALLAATSYTGGDLVYREGLGAIAGR
ncbi:MAG: DUF2231 domain-containing protein [Bacillota bacterium]